MKKLWLSLLLALGAATLPAAETVNLVVSTRDIVGDYYRGNVTLTLIYPQLRTDGTNLFSRQPKSVQPSTTGVAIFTNVLWGYYRLDLAGNPSASFNLTVGTNLSGYVSAAVCITNAAAFPPNPATNYYTQAQVDALIASATNLQSGISAEVATNAALTVVSGSTNGFITATIATNAAITEASKATNGLAAVASSGSASDITSGLLSASVLPVRVQYLAVDNAANLTNLPTSGIAATGGDSTSYLRKDGTWATPAGGTATNATDTAAGTGIEVATNGLLRTVSVSTNIFVDGGTNQSSYASLAAAVSDAFIKGIGRIVVSTTTIVTNSLTVPAGVILQVNSGGKIVVSNGATLTLNTPLEAGEFQVFDWDVTGSPPIINLSKNGEWRTSWFAGKDSATTNTHKRLQVALDNISNGTVLFDGGYTISQPLILRTLTSIRGNGKNGKAALNLAARANTNLLVGLDGEIIARVVISDMYFYGNRANNTLGSSIRVAGYLQNAEIRNCWFSYFAEVGISIASAGSVTLQNNDVHFCRTGIHIGWNGGAFGISMLGNNVENNYEVGTQLDTTSGFAITQSYIEGNPVHYTASTNTQIVLRNCRGGRIAENYFGNYGPLGISLTESCASITIENNVFYWAHGVPYQYDFTCSDIRVLPNNNYNFNPYPWHSQGDFSMMLGDSLLSPSKSTKDQYQLPERARGYWAVLSNRFDVFNYPGAWVNTDGTETTSGALSTAPLPDSGLNELNQDHSDSDHAFANYYAIPLSPTNIPSGGDIVFFAQSRLNVSTPKWGWAIDGTWYPRTNYAPRIGNDDYYWLKPARIADVQLLPHGTTNCEYRIQPAGEVLTVWPGSVEISASGLMGGRMETFTNDVPIGWLSSGSPTVTSNGVAFLYVDDNVTNAKPCVQVTGDTGATFYQTFRSTVVSQSLSKRMRVGFWIRCDAGAVGVQPSDANVHSLGLYAAKSAAYNLTNTWTWVERVVRSSGGSLQFVCRSNGTRFYLKDVYAVPVKSEIVTHEPQRIESTLGVVGNLSLASTLTLTNDSPDSTNVIPVATFVRKTSAAYPSNNYGMRLEFLGESQDGNLYRWGHVSVQNTLGSVNNRRPQLNIALFPDGVETNLLTLNRSGLGIGTPPFSTAFPKLQLNGDVWFGTSNNKRLSWTGSVFSVGSDSALWSMTDSSGISAANITGTNALKFGASTTNLLSDSGSKINGIGLTNGTITIPGDVSAGTVTVTNLAGNGGSLSNAVDIIAGSGVSVTTNGNKRSFTIAATDGGTATNAIANLDGSGTNTALYASGSGAKIFDTATASINDTSGRQTLDGAGRRLLSLDGGSTAVALDFSDHNNVSFGAYTNNFLGRIEVIGPAIFYGATYFSNNMTAAYDLVVEGELFPAAITMADQTASSWPDVLGFLGTIPAATASTNLYSGVIHDTVSFVESGTGDDTTLTPTVGSGLVMNSAANPFSPPVYVGSTGVVASVFYGSGAGLTSIPTTALAAPSTTAWGGPTNTITVSYPWTDYTLYSVTSDCSITGVVGVVAGKAPRASLMFTNATTSNCTVRLPLESRLFGGLTTNSFTITNGGKMFATSWLVNTATNVGGSYQK